MLDEHQGNRSREEKTSQVAQFLFSIDASCLSRNTLLILQLYFDLVSLLDISLQALSNYDSVPCFFFFFEFNILNFFFFLHEISK